MERLTKYSNDIIRNRAVNILRKFDSKNELSGDELAAISAFCLIERTENRVLKEYEELEEQGKLLKLPCAVGDMVYCIYSRYTKCSEHNQEFEESSCQGCESECDSKREYYIQEQRAYNLDWIVTQITNNHFGKLVFLTKEEAKDALKKL